MPANGRWDLILRLKVKTRHITASSIIPHRLNNFKSKGFDHCKFLNNIDSTYIILTEIIIIFLILWSDDDRCTL